MIGELGFKDLYIALLRESSLVSQRKMTTKQLSPTISPSTLLVPFHLLPFHSEYHLSMSFLAELIQSKEAQSLL